MTFSKGRGYSKKDLVENGTPIILYGRLYTNYQSSISRVNTFVEEQSNSVISNGTEIIVPSSGETSEDIARAASIETAGILLGGDLNIIYPGSKINSNFLALTISNGNPQKELASKAQGKSVVHLRNSDLDELNYYRPTKPEQYKISKFFKKLDNLITLHQCELSLITNIIT